MSRMTFFLYLGITVFATHTFSGSWCLTGVKVIIPVAVKQGDSATLRCHYNLEGEQLYSVKWYKGGREFYRYTPKEIPPQKQFPIPGLTVLQADSNSTHVILDDVSMDNSGPYSCEVSADAPSFFTGYEGAVLQVVEVPKHDPQITGLKPRYRLGDLLRAECASKGSRPAANLTWLVNGEPVDAARIRHQKPYETKGLLNAHLGLRLQITQQQFAGGRLKIRCVASLHDIYYRSSEKSVDLERRKHRLVNFSTSSTTTPVPTINWEYALPAERHPQNTLIFELEGNNGIPTAAATPPTLLPLLLLLITLKSAR